MIPDTYADLLEWEKRSFAHVATVGPGGEPHSSPVWFDWDGESIKFSLTTGRQKYRNLEKDKRVSLSIIDPEDDYRYVEVRGELVDVEPDPNIDFISRMAKKYIDEDRYPWHREGDERVVMVVRPVKVSGMG